MLQESQISDWRAWFPDLLSKSGNASAVEKPAAGISQEFINMNDLALAYSRASKTDRAAIVLKAMELTHGEVQQVAAGLGISRSTVWRLGKGLGKS